MSVADQLNGATGADDALAQLLQQVEAEPGDAERRCRLARHLWELGRRDHALAELRTATEMAPEDPWPHSQLADRLWELGRHDEALAELRKAVTVAPSNPGPRSQLADRLWQLDRHDDALAELRGAIDVAPTSASRRCQLAGRLWELGHHDEALAELRKAVDVEPANPSVRSQLADRLWDAGGREEALAELRRVVDLASGDGRGHAKLADRLWRCERYDEAVESYRRALELQPDNSRWHSLLGHCLTQLRRYDEAIDHYTRAHELRPDDIPTYLDWANVLAAQKQYDAAIERCRAALEREPGYAYAHHNIAFYLWSQGKYAEGRLAWARACDAYERGKQRARDRRDAEYFLHYGNILDEFRGQVDHAEAVYKEGLDLQPGDVGLLASLALAHVKQRDRHLQLATGKDRAEHASAAVTAYWRARDAYARAEASYGAQQQSAESFRLASYELLLAEVPLALEDYEKAETYLLRASSRDAGSTSARAALGVLYSCTEDLSKAVDHLEAAATMDPDDARVRSNLGRAYCKSGLVDKAEVEFRKALDRAPAHVEALLGLADVYLSMGDAGHSEMYEDAIAQLEEAMRWSASERGSKKLSDPERAAVEYSLGYARARLYEGSRELRDESLLRRAEKHFENATVKDPSHRKAKRARAQLASRLRQSRPKWLTERAAPVVIFLLSLVVLVLTQLNFFRWEDAPDATVYSALTFGSLLFMVAGLFLPQILKLKVAGIELEKSSTSQISSTGPLGISR